MKITAEELYKYYVDTLSHCGVFLLEEKDDLILEWHLFEEFNTGAVSFLYIESLKRLYDKGFINEEEIAKCSILREKYFELEETYSGDLNTIRTSDKWKELMELSDEIKEIKRHP